MAVDGASNTSRISNNAERLGSLVSHSLSLSLPGFLLCVCVCVRACVCVLVCVCALSRVPSAMLRSGLLPLSCPLCPVRCTLSGPPRILSSNNHFNGLGVPRR
jgi:hypothetical protein